LSISNIWRSWYRFRRGKKPTHDIDTFSYFLEENLARLHTDLIFGNYRHGGYRSFTVTENKKRDISVAGVRDRVVHRLLYDYLNDIYDKTFIFDVWSCRKNKGLVKAIDRAEEFLRKNPSGYIWRADIKKFFDNVSHEKLLEILTVKTDSAVFPLLKNVIESFLASENRGIPIGNLTSQLFANVYLNELDRFVQNSIKPQAYLRYGDDFIMVEKDPKKLGKMKVKTREFIKSALFLEINPKNDIMVKTRYGIHFLGVDIFPNGRRLKARNWKRARERMNTANISSYSGLIKKHCSVKKIKEFQWKILEIQSG